MDWIEIKPTVMFGKPVVKGTRITVELILEELSVGRSDDKLMREYRLEAQHIHAALAFAADALKGERDYALAV